MGKRKLRGNNIYNRLLVERFNCTMGKLYWEWSKNISNFFYNRTLYYNITK